MPSPSHIASLLTRQPATPRPAWQARTPHEPWRTDLGYMCGRSCRGPACDAEREVGFWITPSYWWFVGRG
jgi:hypothetical protein